ncbi:hypothetical protein N9Y37_06980 [Luminiphilus sp.]|nr:hypothetical protein [Luminiphilus sp.]
MSTRSVWGFHVLLGAVLGLVLGAQQQVLLRAALFVLGAEVFVARTAEDRSAGDQRDEWRAD